MYGDGHPRLRKESSMKISRQSWYSCVLGIILLLGVGCARKLDDAKMSSEIQSKFSQDSGLASKQLTVQANNGVVTLSGTVENAAQRDAAGQQAAAISGVKTVINNLQIGNAVADANPPAKPAPIIESTARGGEAGASCQSAKGSRAQALATHPAKQRAGFGSGLESADVRQHSSSSGANDFHSTSRG